MTFRGNVALVTGGGSGMGQRMCERMAAQGAKVAALDLNEEGLAKTAATSRNITTFPVDVTDRAAVEQIVEKVAADLGPIDRVAAAAAIMPSDALAEMDADLITKVMDVNFNGVVHVTKAVLPQMLERRSGDMIIFASLMGLHAADVHGGLLRQQARREGLRRDAQVRERGLRHPLHLRVPTDAVKTPAHRPAEAQRALASSTCMPESTAAVPPTRSSTRSRRASTRASSGRCPGIAKPAAAVLQDCCPRPSGTAA